MDVFEMVSQAREAMTVRRVYGDPYEKEGVTIIPAAKVRGGADAGGGKDNKRGSGVGYRIDATPVGAYVIKEGKVKWKPAFNLNRAILGGQTVAVVALLVVRSLVRARAGEHGERLFRRWFGR
ncbi:MAG: hypothetical protein JOZ19_04690 [Rubrobacter sp.]|nr:hypothetical protein [Rubrobacter sp.]